MTTLAFGRTPISEGLIGTGTSASAQTVTDLAYSALGKLASSFSPVKHELYALHLESDRGEAEDELDADTLMTAVQFITAMPKHLPAPALDVDSDGEVLFDWSPRRGRMLTVSLRQDGRISYAARFGAGRMHRGTEFFTGAFPTWLSEHIQALSA